MAAGIAIWHFCFAPYDISDATFPDAAVRTAILTVQDADHDGKLSRDEARAVTSLTVDGASSVAGLGRYLPNLSSLTLTGTSLSSVDTSDLGSLESLDVRGTSVSSLDVSKNPKLSNLGADDAVQVNGIDATNLRETWLPGEIDRGGQKFITTYNPDGTVAKLDIQELNQGTWGTRASRTFTWEGGHPVSQVQFYDDHGYGSNTETRMDYDGAGRLTSASSQYSTTTFSYDDAGNLVRKAYDGNTFDYAYDDAGRCVKETRSFGASGTYVTTYAYDDQGRCVTRTETGPYQTNVTTYAYDADGNVTSVTDTDSNSNDLSYTYEGGRLTAVRAQPKSAAGRGESWELAYDDAGRLTGTQEDGASPMTYDISYVRLFTSKDAPTPEAGFSVGPSYQTFGAVRINVIGVSSPRFDDVIPIPFDASTFVTRTDMWY